MNKKVLYAGKGDIPNFSDGCKIFFNYEARYDNEDKTVLDDTRKPYPHGYGEPLELVLGKQFKVPVFETCLCTMRVGEVATFHIPSHDLLQFPFVAKQLRDISKQRVQNKGAVTATSTHCCGSMLATAGLGYSDLDAYLRKPEDMYVTFELLSVLQPDQYEAQSWQLKSEEKLASVSELRERGNKLFKAGNVKQAANDYSEAISRLEVLLLEEKPQDEAWLHLDKMKLPLFLNLCQCRLVEEDYYDAIRCADEVLSREPTNEKALFRRAKAHEGAWNLVDAKRDWQTVLKLNPQLSSVVHASLKRLDELEKANKAADTEKFKAIWAK